MEGIQHRDRVGQLVTDPVRIATERIQRGLFDGGGKSVGLVLQPRLVSGPGPADDRVKESGMEASVLVTGQIDHNRHRPVGADPARAPDVLIDSQGLHTGKAFGLRDPGLGFGLDRGPGSVPGNAETTGQRRHGGVVMAERIVAHRTARTVNTARGGAIGCCSVKVVVAQPGSRQRQTLLNQRTTVTRPRLGASCNTRQRRPCPTASTPSRDSRLQLIRLHGQHQPVPIIDLTSVTCIPGTSNIASSRHTSAHPGHTYSGSPSRPSSDSLVASDPEGLDALTT
jgi:hypothetical protein